MLERATLDAFGDLVVIVNGGILLYKNARALNHRPISVPTWVLSYLVTSLLFSVFSVTFGTLYLGDSLSGPAMAVANAIIVFSILISPAHFGQHVKRRESMEQLTKQDDDSESLTH